MTSRTLVLGLFLCACGGPGEPPAAAPSAPVAPAPETATRIAGAPAAPADVAAPAASAAPAPSVPQTAAAPPAAEPAPASTERPPGVTARSLGMHIGGGPNDSATKAPFTRTIEGAFDAMLACTAHVPGDRREGTFGVDLLVGKDGGKPQVSNPRTGIPGTEFRACVVAAFEALAFDRPKRGATKLSYSLRFHAR